MDPTPEQVPEPERFMQRLKRFAVVIALWLALLPLEEAYSGGGATFDIADFVSLSEADGSFSPVLRDVPLSCSKMVRACFSEDDYRRLATNCHDLYDGSLTLSYSQAASPDRYEWTAVWHERDQGQGMSKSQAVSTGQRIKVPQEAADRARVFRSVSICGGGPMEEG